MNYICVAPRWSIALAGADQAEFNRELMWVAQGAADSIGRVRVGLHVDFCTELEENSWYACLHVFEWGPDLQIYFDRSGNWPASPSDAVSGGSCRTSSRASTMRSRRLQCRRRREDHVTVGGNHGVTMQALSFFAESSVLLAGPW